MRPGMLQILIWSKLVSRRNPPYLPAENTSINMLGILNVVEHDHEYWAIELKDGEQHDQYTHSNSGLIVRQLNRFFASESINHTEQSDFCFILKQLSSYCATERPNHIFYELIRLCSICGWHDLDSGKRKCSWKSLCAGQLERCTLISAVKNLVYSE